MCNLIKIIQGKREEQLVRFRKYSMVGNAAMKNMAAAKMNILDDILEMTDGNSCKQNDCIKTDVLKSVCCLHKLVENCKHYNNGKCDFSSE